MKKETSNQLRCFCSKKPLLATYGIDKSGALYIHQKVYKQGRIFGESVVYGGLLKICCRECYRWHKVVIRQSNVPLLEAELEVPIKEEDPPNHACGNVAPTNKVSQL